MTPVAPKATRPGAILLVGAGYGAIKAAQDVAEAGKPLVWITRAPHFLEPASGAKRFEPQPEDLDFQFRPLYLRVTRHPLVTALTRAHISAVEKRAGGYWVSVVHESPFIDYDLCTGCGRCMEVCPLADSPFPPLTRTPPYCPSRALDLDKRKAPPCREACPLGVNVQAYVALIAAGRFQEALEVVRRDNPLPGVCGRVCHHPCEEVCRRREVDEAVAICELKRFLADWEVTQGRLPAFDVRREMREERVAVIGSGPAGLSAAYFLASEGFPVTIFEANEEAGGMLRTGINAFRLPREVLDREIAAIEALGVEIKTASPVTDMEGLLRAGYRAVILCIGAHRDLKLGIDGEDAANVMGAVEMLRLVNTGKFRTMAGRVAVIGGGNSALDAARAALRLGAREVTICYRREKRDMPAIPSEIAEAEEEGIHFLFRVTPSAFRYDEVTRKVKAIEFTRMNIGEPDESGRRRPIPIPGSQFLFDTDYVIVAVGQEADWSFLKTEGLLRDSRQRLVCDRNIVVGRPGVFAAGDVVTGPRTVVEAMAQGRSAAAAVSAYLERKAVPYRPDREAFPGREYRDIPPGTVREARAIPEKRHPELRTRDFLEVSRGFSEGEAVTEAKRCLECAVCCECLACEEVCKPIGAVDHRRRPRTMSFFAPSIIVADRDEFRDRENLVTENVHYIGDFRETTDIVNVLIAGSAAAGRAMMDAPTLKARKLPEKKRPLFRGNDRSIGVFICTCNGTMASGVVVDEIQRIAQLMPGVVHCSTVVSACSPTGADDIAQTVRQENIGRVILASCACCPLEFQCISCNDQRNRVRLHLFNQRGLDRSKFEMVNLRDHLGVGVCSDRELVARASRMLREAYFRLRFLTPLGEGATDMGRSILILGGSEVGINCARILDLQGFRVKLVHKCRLKGETLPAEVAGRPEGGLPGKHISDIPEATVIRIKGHMGNFEAKVEVEGKLRTWRADIVCIADLHLLPLAIPEGTFGLKKFYRYNFAFFNTPQVGLYRVMPRTLRRVSAGQAGAALAAHVASAAAEAYMKDNELSPTIDRDRCRGCGRCVEICPFNAVYLRTNERGFYTAEVLRYNCVGCGGCVGRCPVTAIDMPYFSNRIIDSIVTHVMEDT